MRHPIFNTGLAVGMTFFFAISGTVRQMWPIFGAGNQLIGALALTTVSVWLVQRARQHLFVLLPAIFMILTTLAALFLPAIIWRRAIYRWRSRRSCCFA